MSTVVIAPLLVAFGAGVSTLLLRTNVRLQRAASVLGGLAYLVAVALLFDHVVMNPTGPTIATYYVSNWPAPFGITLVADALAAFMLGLSAIVAALVSAGVGREWLGRQGEPGVGLDVVLSVPLAG